MFLPFAQPFSDSVLSDSFTEMHSDMPEDDPLLRAVKQKDYAALDALLKDQSAPLDPRLAFELVYWGIEDAIPIPTFQAILEHSPPPEQFFSFHNLMNMCSERQIFSLAEKAALSSCPEHLDRLLDRGFSPNGDPNRPGSDALLCAFHSRSPSCVSRLVREPGLDRTLTPELLSMWAEVGRADTRDLRQCCLAAAPLLIADGEPDRLNGVPIPRQLTVLQAASKGNWALTEHLCRRDGLTAQDGKKLMEQLAETVNRLTFLPGESLRWHARPSRWNTAIGQRALVSLLNAAFSACPRLLHRRLPRTLLCFAALSGRAVPKQLRPWLDQAPGRRIILDPALSMAVFSRMLPLWQPRFGSRWVPVLDPWHAPRRDLDFFLEILREDMDLLFTYCQLRSFAPRKALAPLSEQVLHQASLSQLLRQLQPGGLLQMESPRVLERSLVPASDDPWAPPPLEPQRRQAILAHIRKVEVDYEL